MTTRPQSRAHGPARAPPVRSSMRFIPHKDRRRVAAALKLVYTAPGEEAALGALEDFAESDPGPAAPRRWRRGTGPRPVHAVPGLPAHGAPRRVSPTGVGGAPSTNAIESLNHQLRKVTKNRGHYSPPTRPRSNYCDQQTRNSDERARERDKDQGEPASKRTAPPRPIPRPTHHQPQNKPQHELTAAHPDRTTPYL